MKQPVVTGILISAEAHTRASACVDVGLIISALCTAFFELPLDGFEGEVDSLFKRVGGLGGDDVFNLRRYGSDDGFFVHRGLGFDDFEGYVDICDCVIAAGKTLGFLVDEFDEAVGDVEVDGLNFNFHNLKF